MGALQRAERENPAIIENDQQLEQEVQVPLGESWWKCMSPIGQQLRRKTLS